MVDIKQLETLYFVNGNPTPYNLKNGGEILIYPVLVEDWGIFENSLNVLKIMKNEINNPDVIQMKYLEYLYLISKYNDSILFQLATIIKYVLHEQIIAFHTIDEKINLAITDEDGVIKYCINQKEFDDIKSIILHQNLHDYDDRYISPDIRKAIERYNKLKMKNQVAPTLEKQKIFVISKTGMSELRINKMTYRAFIQVYSMSVKEDIYMANTMIKSSYRYEIKDNLVHPIYEKDRDILDEIFVDADSFVKKIENT